MTLTKAQAEDLTGMAPEARELVNTIVDAAMALARLLPDKELEQGFEFPWGHHFYSRGLLPRASLFDFYHFNPLHLFWVCSFSIYRLGG